MVSLDRVRWATPTWAKLISSSLGRCSSSALSLPALGYATHVAGGRGLWDWSQPSPWLRSSLICSCTAVASDATSAFHPLRTLHEVQHEPALQRLAAVMFPLWR